MLTRTLRRYPPYEFKANTFPSSRQRVIDVLFLSWDMKNLASVSKLSRVHSLSSRPFVFKFQREYRMVRDTKYGSFVLYFFLSSSLISNPIKSLAARALAIIVPGGARRYIIALKRCSGSLFLIELFLSFARVRTKSFRRSLARCTFRPRAIGQINPIKVRRFWICSHSITVFLFFREFHNTKRLRSLISFHSVGRRAFSKWMFPGFCSFYCLSIDVTYLSMSGYLQARRFSSKELASFGSTPNFKVRVTS